MSTLDWQRVRALFEEICDLEAGERQRRIEASALGPAALRLIESMLLADRDPRMGDDAGMHAPQVVAALAVDERIGSVVGAWRIETLIGAGGMGRVYRARREDGRYQGLAAIKFVAEAANPDFFEHERHVLARCNHVGIARLLDAGEDANGRSYVVMEYVAGGAIDDYCRERQADARQRITLIIAAARAIAHAHAQWVLHRDLKPANLLVDQDGQVKVLDFGVAKMLDRAGADPQLTAARYFTLSHAAPEQIAGEATGVAVDIYALAVILYQLLCSEHPFATQPEQNRSLVERVLAGDATPLRRCLKRNGDPMLAAFTSERARDLEAVLSRALARDPLARYASAQEFGDELERVLGDRPVLARTASARAVLWRLARRHRIAVALGCAAIVSLLALTGIAVWQARAAAIERDAAHREAARAERISAFLTGLFEASQPIRNKGVEPKARDLLDRGREQLANEKDLDAAMLARLQATMADSYRALGLYADAEALLRQALDAAGDDAQMAARLQLQLGRVHNFQSRWQDAEAALRLGLQQAQALPSDDLVAALQRQLAVSLINQNRPDDAEAAATAALAILRRASPPQVKEVVDSEMLLATISYSRGDLPAAQAAYARIVDTQRGSDPEAPGLVTSLNNLAAIEMRLDRLDEAQDHYRQAVTLARRSYGERNREVALPLLGLGSALRASGQIDAAQQALREARQIYLDWTGAAHPETAYASLLHAEMLWLSGQDEAARAAMVGVSAQLADENPQSVKSCRARLLDLALAAPGAIDSAAQPDPIACLRTPQTPANLQLLARYVAARLALPGAEPATALRGAAEQLKPRDAGLQQAISRWAEAGVDAG